MAILIPRLRQARPAARWSIDDGDVLRAATGRWRHALPRAAAHQQVTPACHFLGATTSEMWCWERHTWMLQPPRADVANGERDDATNRCSILEPVHAYAGIGMRDAGTGVPRCCDQGREIVSMLEPTRLNAGTAVWRCCNQHCEPPIALHRELRRSPAAVLQLAHDRAGTGCRHAGKRTRNICMFFCCDGVASMIVV